MNTTWRDILPVHPAADALPLLSPEALRELANDIKTNGLQQEPVVYRDGVGEGTAWLLDGRNRLDAMALLGIDFLSRGDDGKLHWSFPGRAWAPTYEYRDDPAAYVITANLARRHLRPQDLVMHALAVRAAVRWQVGSRTQPLTGVERRDDDGLRQTRSSVRVSTGGRGHKSEATEIAEQTGVPARTVRRVLARKQDVETAAPAKVSDGETYNRGEADVLTTYAAGLRDIMTVKPSDIADWTNVPNRRAYAQRLRRIARFLQSVAARLDETQ